MHKATLMKQQSTDAETNDTSYLIENGALKELLDFDVVTPEQSGKDQKKSADEIIQFNRNSYSKQKASNQERIS